MIRFKEVRGLVWFLFLVGASLTYLFTQSLISPTPFIPIFLNTKIFLLYGAILSFFATVFFFFLLAKYYFFTKKNEFDNL